MKTPILFAALSATALFAQTSAQALEKRVEAFGELTRLRDVKFSNASGGDIIDRAGYHKYSGGLRLMGELPGTQGWYFSLGGKLESSARLATNGAVGGGATLNTTDVSIRYSYWLAGVSKLFDLGSGLTIGAHGEARGEAISAVGYVQASPSGSGDVNQSTTYLRPWIRASIDWTWKRPGVSPYLGLDIGMPLVRTNQSAAVAPTQMDSNTLKSMAPASTANVYVGLRF